MRRRAAAGVVDRHPFWGAALFPGLVVVSESRTTQWEAFLIAVVVAGFVLLVGLPRTEDAPVWRGKRASWYRIALVVALYAWMIPVAFRTGGYLPAVMSSPAAQLALAIGSIMLFTALRLRVDGSAPKKPLVSLCLLALVLASLYLRRIAPAFVCLPAWLGLGALAVIFAVRGGRRFVVELLALSSYAWVSRDAEFPFLLSTYLIAVLVGEALRGEGGGNDEERPLPPSMIFAVVTFAFCLAYVQRVGVELGLDFTNFDWGAGAFRQQGVSIVRVGGAISYNTASRVWGCSRPFSRRSRRGCAFAWRRGSSSRSSRALQC